MALEDSSDEQDSNDEDDGINEAFLAALKPRRRKITKDDIHGDDEDEDAQEMKRSLEGWGRDKTQFYDTNFVDPDFGTDSEDERMAAAEEEEALLLQQQQAETLDDADFGLEDLPPAPKDKRSKGSRAKLTSSVAEVEEIPKDFESMSLAERTKYVKRARPELAALQQLCGQLVRAALSWLLVVCQSCVRVLSLSHTMSYLVSSLQQAEKTDLLDPLLQLLGNTTSIPVLRALGLPPGIQPYLRQRDALVATYAMTIASYLLLVAKETPGLEDHPIGHALLSLQQVLGEVSESGLISAACCVCLPAHALSYCCLLGIITSL
jgi:hypothetical protein